MVGRPSRDTEVLSRLSKRLRQTNKYLNLRGASSDQRNECESGSTLEVQGMVIISQFPSMSSNKSSFNFWFAKPWDQRRTCAESHGCGRDSAGSRSRSSYSIPFISTRIGRLRHSQACHVRSWEPSWGKTTPPGCSPCMPPAQQVHRLQLNSNQHAPATSCGLVWRQSQRLGGDRTRC